VGEKRGWLYLGLATLMVVALGSLALLVRATWRSVLVGVLIAVVVTCAIGIIAASPTGRVLADDFRTFARFRRRTWRAGRPRLLVLGGSHAPTLGLFLYAPDHGRIGHLPPDPYSGMSASCVVRSRKRGNFRLEDVSLIFAEASVAFPHDFGDWPEPKWPPPKGRYVVRWTVAGVARKPRRRFRLNAYGRPIVSLRARLRWRAKSLFRHLRGESSVQTALRDSFE
jgi:hypothetical protein